MSVICLYFQKAVEAATPWLACAAVGLAFLSLAMFLHGKRPLANGLNRFSRLSPFHRLVVVCAVCFLTLWGGSKERGPSTSGTGDGNPASGACIGEIGQPRSLPSTNALAIAEFEIDQASCAAYFAMSWAEGLFDGADSRNVYLFASTNLLERKWMPLCTISMPSDTNACAFAVTSNDVDAVSLPWFLDTFDGIGFYRFGIDVDSDGDGLPDPVEALWHLTDPLDADTDGDGIPDGWEIENGLDPNSFADAYADPDEDGIPNLYEYHHGTMPHVADAANIERIVAGGTGPNAVETLAAALAASSPYSVIEVADGVHEGPGWSGFAITLPEYPVLITSSDGGRSRRAVIRHSSQFAAMYLNATQTTHTVVQGLSYVLEATSGMQMAFWCGSSTPWSGDPAAGMFRNIYVRMPNPGVQYEGWFFRHYESNQVVIASCTINASGATNARGIYAVDSPPMSVENCTFVNFPRNDTGIGYGIQYESTAQNLGGAPDPIPLEIVNCLFDVSFTNAFALAPLENGVSYEVTMLNCIVPSALEYEADVTEGLIVTNAGVSSFGHISGGSPARGAGVPSLYAPLDIDGQDRGAIPDIGADEFHPGAESADTDGDGLSDADEDWIHGTDPLFADSDWDGSPDGMEIANGTDPWDSLSFMANVVLSVTNTCASATLTNYFGLSMSQTGWDVTNAYATTSGCCVTQVVESTAGLYGKAFADLNRNGIYDEGYDVIRIVGLESDYAIVDARFSLGDIDGDGVSDESERTDGTDPYDASSFLMLATVSIKNSDPGHDITNYVVHSTSLSAAVPVASNALFVSATYNYPISAIATEGKIYVRGFRDLNRNGAYDEGVDCVFSCNLDKNKNGKVVNLAIGDADADKIPDSREVSEGTSPLDRLNYCFNCEVGLRDIFSTSNSLVAQAFFGSDCLYGPEVQTNMVLTLDFGHIVVTNGEHVVFYFWDDLDGDMTRDDGEPFTSVTIYPKNHDAPHRQSIPFGGFDTNKDGLLDWWQGLYQLEDGDYDDTDGDGMINLHEYWAGTDPTIPDGSNTVLSVAARSVDERLVNASPSNSLERYTDYQVNGMNLSFVSNTNFWGGFVDLSCASMWNNAGHDIWGGPCECWHMAGTAISRRHLICAYHFGIPNGATVYFMSTSSVVVARQVVARRSVGTDVMICALDSDLPDTILPAKILPANYKEYIGSAKGLPVVTLDQEEKLIVCETGPLQESSTRASLSYGEIPNAGRRIEFYEKIVSGDSGSPRFMLVGQQVVLLYVIYSGEAGAGYFVTHYKDEIQQAMNQMCPGYLLEEVDLSSYQKIERLQ